MPAVFSIDTHDKVNRQGQVVKELINNRLKYTAKQSVSSSMDLAPREMIQANETNVLKLGRIRYWQSFLNDHLPTRDFLGGQMLYQDDD